MLKKRIIPIVLLDGFSVLKTINFSDRRNLGSPITVLKTYNTRNVDELILLDIDASKQNRSIDKFTIEEISKECFMPLTVGGGIESIYDVEELLKKGADKVSLNYKALENPAFISEASNIFGSQCITISVDVIVYKNNYQIYSKGKVINELNLTDWVKRIEDLGAGEILINSVDRDGLMEGGDYRLAKIVSESVNIPVIYAGGISSPNDASIIAKSSVSGLGISSIFHFTNYTPEDCREALRETGIPARKPADQDLRNH